MRCDLLIELLLVPHHESRLFGQLARCFVSLCGFFGGLRKLFVQNLRVVPLRPVLKFHVA